MKNVITGASSIDKDEVAGIIATLSNKVKNFRFVNDLERLTIVAIDLLLKSSGIQVPVGKDNIGIYIGIDDVIEDIKDEFLGGVIKDGLLGASPIQFPFTSPNALAAQATIVFDIRGESVVMPIRDSILSVITYADECISGRYMDMAIAGGVVVKGEKTGNYSNDYKANFYMIENLESANARGATIYNSLPESLV